MLNSYTFLLPICEIVRYNKKRRFAPEVEHCAFLELEDEIC